MDTKFFDAFENSLDDFFDYPNFSILNHDDKISSETLTSVVKSIGYSVTIDNTCKSFCIGCVDMVNSTKISAHLSTTNLSRYYQIFLNSMSKILSKYGGSVIKNVGDCLLYYFPSSSKLENKSEFVNCIDCNLALIDARNFLCSQLRSEGLPCLNYRISSDYGSVCLMHSNNSSSLDMIGPSVNMCAKINRFASPNEIVIGGDLYEIIKSFKEYTFKLLSSYSLGFKISYPVYSVSRKIPGI
ncbi:MAG: adenylate/guanylate cyclase domain-containing protein [Nitrosarchaeum sp.]|nr:adenylate/guanylate cyclase domain-containing protein [Nitrosarchaeum sp.]